MQLLQVLHHLRKRKGRKYIRIAGVTYVRYVNGIVNYSDGHFFIFYSLTYVWTSEMDFTEGAMKKDCLLLKLNFHLQDYGIASLAPIMPFSLLSPTAVRSHFISILFFFSTVCSDLSWKLCEGGIVKNTLRPTIPERCDPEWRKLMEQCWAADPEARPSFTEITSRLRTISAAIQSKCINSEPKQTKPIVSA